MLLPFTVSEARRLATLEGGFHTAGTRALEMTQSRQWAKPIPVTSVRSSKHVVAYVYEPAMDLEEVIRGIGK